MAKILDRYHIRHSPHLAPVSLFLLALGLRLWGIGSESIWTDEMATLHRARMDLLGLLENTSTHGQLPLYFVLLNLWIKVAGTDEVALRIPSAIIGSVNVFLSYQLICRLRRDLGPRVGTKITSAKAKQSQNFASSRYGTGKLKRRLDGSRSLHLGPMVLPWPFIGALIVATNPILIYMGQDARTYTLLLLASWLLALAVLVPLRWQRPLGQQEGGLLALGMVILVASHYIGWVICLGVVVILLLQRRELRIGNWNVRTLWPLLPALLWVVTWLSYMLITGNWPDTELHESATLASNLADFGDEHLSPNLLVIVPVLLACWLGYRAFHLECTSIARVCLLWVLAIILAVLVMSAISNSYFVARYFLPIIVPLLILAGRGFYFDWPNSHRLLLLGLVLLLALGQTAWQVATPQKAQWREAAEFINEHKRPDEPVVVAPRWERGTLGYYLETAEPMSLEQVRLRIDREGENLTFAGFWVIFRSDQHEVRDVLRVDLDGRFKGSHYESERSLQIWYFESLLTKT